MCHDVDNYVETGDYSFFAPNLLTRKSAKNRPLNCIENVKKPKQSTRRKNQLLHKNIEIKLHFC